MAKGYVLMADIIRSSERNSETLIRDFKEVISVVKKKYSREFLSPITITLGDEFQSIVKSLNGALDIVLFIEETIIRQNKDFKLRYVIEYGEIDTRINSKIAYEMLGTGLTSAREHLINSKKERDKRVHIYLQDTNLSFVLEGIFYATISIRDKWKSTDNYLISSFLSHRNYLKVANDLEIDRSQIWKREKTLMMKEYFALVDSLKKIV